MFFSIVKENLKSFQELIKDYKAKNTCLTELYLTLLHINNDNLSIAECNAVKENIHRLENLSKIIDKIQKEFVDI
ncbi:MAG: hypothetical protein NC191_03525 [Muribaculaceae bacterium]|nr:hypothetical protein [Muribaculaceae bacterium]